MATRATNRTVRALWLTAVLVGLLALITTAALAQDAPAAPAAPANATLTLGVTTTPAGGQDFWLTAVSFQSSWGSGGKQQGQFRQPRDVEIDAAGNFYISDHRNSRIQKFGATGNFISVIGGPGKGQGKLLRPNAIAISGNQLAVADTDNHRVVIYNTTGAFVRQWGTFGTGNGQFDRPNGVAYDAAGNLYVADTWNHRIQVFNSQGVYVRQWGTLGSGDGQLRFPAHLDFDAGGNLFVADSNNHRVQVFTADGVFVRKFGVTGTAPGQLRYPVGIDVADGFVYVTDTFNNRVQKYTATGAFVAVWSQVVGNNTISRPNGLLAVGNRLYVSDIDANRIQIFSQATATVDHAQQVPLTLPAGTYSVTQAPQTGWTFSSATCTGGNPTAIAGGVRLSLADGAAVSCTFASNQ